MVLQALAVVVLPAILHAALGHLQVVNTALPADKAVVPPLDAVFTQPGLIGALDSLLSLPARGVQAPQVEGCEAGPVTQDEVRPVLGLQQTALSAQPVVMIFISNLPAAEQPGLLPAW